MTSMYSLRGRIRGHYDSHAMVGVIASNPRRKNLSFSLALNVTIMAVSSNERRRNVQKVVLCTVISMLIENRRRQLFKRKQVKRFWTRGIFRDRKLHSEYYTLYLDLRDNDREFHYRSSETMAINMYSMQQNIYNNTTMNAIDEGKITAMKSRTRKNPIDVIHKIHSFPS